MTPRTSTLLTAVALSAAIAGCGGKSGPSDTDKAVTILREETIPIGANGAPVKPTSVKCKSGKDGPNCVLIYPDGQVHNCFVSISGNSHSVSCAVDLKATKLQRAKQN